MTVAEVQGPRSVKVQLTPNGVLQKRHVDRLQRGPSAGEEEIQEDSKEDSKKQSPGSPKVLSAIRSPRPQCNHHPPDRLIVNSKLRKDIRERIEKGKCCVKHHLLVPSGND